MTPSESVTPISLDERLLELETSLIMWALNAANGNKSQAAKLLLVKRSTLGDRIRRCGLDKAVDSGTSVAMVDHREARCET